MIGSAYDLVLDSCGAAMRAGAALAVAATAAFHRCLGVLIKGVSKSVATRVMTRMYNIAEKERLFN
jgi:hypothetical protein